LKTVKPFLDDYKVLGTGPINLSGSGYPD